MPLNFPISPRAAIQTWLAQTKKPSEISQADVGAKRAVDSENPKSEIRKRRHRDDSIGGDPIAFTQQPKRKFGENAPNMPIGILPQRTSLNYSLIVRTSGKQAEG